MYRFRTNAPYVTSSLYAASSVTSPSLTIRGLTEILLGYCLPVPTAETEEGYRLMLRILHLLSDPTHTTKKIFSISPLSPRPPEQGRCTATLFTAARELATAKHHIRCQIAHAVTLPSNTPTRSKEFACKLFHSKLSRTVGFISGACNRQLLSKRYKHRLRTYPRDQR